MESREGICNSYPTNKIQNLKNFIEHATSKSKQRRRRRESSPAPPSRSDRHRRGGELPNEDLAAERIREKTLALNRHYFIKAYRLYTCKSLVILKLRGEIRLDVPRLSCLPSLKTFELILDKYFQGGPLRRLLSICPVLENLLVNCGWDDYDKGLITVTVPSLQRLTLYLHSETEGDSSNLLARLLEDSPNLRVLDIFEIDHDDRDYEELISTTVRTVRESVLSNLRTFNWSRYFERRPQEMDLAVYILGEKWCLKDCNNLV
ncbi:hypothetical protein YC2023_113740 [Brassica napus]